MRPSPTQADAVTVTDTDGIRLFKNGKEIARIDGDAALFVRLARECLNIAKIKEA